MRLCICACVQILSSKLLPLIYAESFSAQINVSAHLLRVCDCVCVCVCVCVFVCVCVVVYMCYIFQLQLDRVVKASVRRSEGPGFEFRRCRIEQHSQLCRDSPRESEAGYANSRAEIQIIDFSLIQTSRACFSTELAY